MADVLPALRHSQAQSCHRVPSLGCAAGPHSLPPAPEPGLGGFQPSEVGRCWSLHGPSFGHHSNGDRVPWLSQALISCAWMSAMSLLLSPVAFWLCATPGAGTWPAHTSHTDLLWVPEQTQPQPCPPVFWDQVRLSPVLTANPLRIWTPGWCSACSPQPIFSSSLAAPQREDTHSSLLTFGTRSSSFYQPFPPFCTKQLHSLFSKSF